MATVAVMMNVSEAVQLAIEAADLKQIIFKSYYEAIQWAVDNNIEDFCIYVDDPALAGSVVGYGKQNQLATCHSSK